MSMSTSFYADHANTMKSEWVALLNAALAAGSLEQVAEVMAKMEAFWFSE